VKNRKRKRGIREKVSRGLKMHFRESGLQGKRLDKDTCW
jgi:hypothetical protein